MQDFKPSVHLKKTLETFNISFAPSEENTEKTSMDDALKGVPIALYLISVAINEQIGKVKMTFLSPEISMEKKEEALENLKEKVSIFAKELEAYGDTHGYDHFSPDFNAIVNFTFERVNNLMENAILAFSLANAIVSTIEAEKEKETATKH